MTLGNHPLSHATSVAPLQHASRSLPRLQVHSSSHYLQTEKGDPFFWLGDTAWQLIHSTTREECSYYLQTRATQGYTVIQAVVLAEMNGVRKPSALGLLPFKDEDSLRPNDLYFDRVVEIVDEAARYGLYVALLPTWGDKLTAPWGDGPRIFRNDNLATAHTYGSYLAKKLKGRTNVIWMLGGDRPARIRDCGSEYLIEKAKSFDIDSKQDWTPIWAALADGLNVEEHALTLYHPQGGSESTSILLRDADWLSVNGIQSGHGAGRDTPNWELIARDYALTPAKPTLDLEPNYEDHPYNPWPAWDPATGYFRDYDVRKQLYRSVFAGACGVTYGHHAVWQFASLRNGVINHADRDWIDALQRPAGRQAVFLRRLIESRPFFARAPDQSVLLSTTNRRADHVQATRALDGSYLLVYIPCADQPISLNLSSMPQGERTAWWYDPRTGIGTRIAQSFSGSKVDVTTPPYGPDWVLVVDDARSGFGPPGLDAWNS
ncbi:glycoside hydrolase family 140 protein [Tunturiibacter empetritectus]|uniref:DUF4038 domain-containing protein n=1 Tax=Tunturiibacter lichenicola TaxID=2051959 RepID=A0A852VHH6_9BACT|nr:glycoside hydrolase family 140 protein [Edaphobacter lichenicola]NYF89894.1 hypothetical protein [Edaphobacter lichenicola]